MPLLRELSPAADATLARSARHLAEADLLLGDLAEMDAQTSMAQGRLRVDALQGLGAARARNLLRWFIRAHGLEVPGAVEMDEVLRQVIGARRDAGVQFDVGDGTVLRRYRNALWLAPSTAPPGRRRMTRGDRPISRS